MSATQDRELQVVIGLEVHVQLETDSKIFCGCSTDFADAPPNSHTCPVCLGLPGALPTLNEAAVRAALQVTKALNGTVPAVTGFHRKNYFYPDLPKNYQITQYDDPVCQDASLSISVNDERRTVRIERAHLEEDPGRLDHEGGDIARAEYTLVDYNRAGVPLLEIVTKPDFRSPAETRAFLAKLEEVLEYLGVFNPGRDGSLRVDANVSLVAADAANEDGSISDTVLADAERIEVKNISSHRGAEQALAFEITRQRNVYRRGGSIEPETRHWDESRGVTVSLRTKEAEADYRYFREANLPVLRVRDWFDEISIPELPDARRARFQREYDLGTETAAKVTSSREVAEFFEAIATRYDPQLAATWVADNLLGELHYRDMDILEVDERLDEFERLIELVDSGDITVKNAEEIVLREMLDSGEDPDTIVESRNLGTASDDVVTNAVDEAIAENPAAVEDVAAGEAGAINYLVGQVMQKTKGKADPETVNRTLRTRLDAS